MIDQVCKKSKLWIPPNLGQPGFSFTYLFKFAYFCIVYLDLEKGILSTKPLKVIKTTTNHKNFNKDVLKKLNMQLEIPNCLKYGPKSYNV